jgi:hypothetical protein
MSEWLVIRVKDKVITAPNVRMKATEGVHNTIQLLAVSWPTLLSGLELPTDKRDDVRRSDVFIHRSRLKENTTNSSLRRIGSNMEW